MWTGARRRPAEVKLQDDGSTHIKRLFTCSDFGGGEGRGLHFNILLDDDTKCLRPPPSPPSPAHSSVKMISSCPKSECGYVGIPSLEWDHVHDRKARASVATEHDGSVIKQSHT